jgi:hypothetical protein
MSTDYARIADLVNTYKSFPLGTADASDVDIAEPLGPTDVAALDRHHLMVILVLAISDRFRTVDGGESTSGRHTYSARAGPGPAQRSGMRKNCADPGQCLHPDRSLVRIPG